jgi:hypothetical protein
LIEHDSFSNADTPGQSCLFKVQEKQRLTLLRWALAMTIALTASALYQGISLALALGVMPTWKWIVALVIGFGGLAFEVAVLVATWTTLITKFSDGLEAVVRILSRVRVMNLLALAVLVCLLPALVLSYYGNFMEGFFLRLFPLWGLALVGSVFLRAFKPRLTWMEAFIPSLLLHAFVYRVAAFIPWVSTYPFSLDYSEGSRHYYASLFFAKRIYGVTGLGLPVLHPTRYILQSIPFLVPGMPLWAHRLWQVLLWIGMTSTAAIFLIRRLSIPGTIYRVVWFLWAFLFMFQGPVYYHLMLMVIVVLWGVDPHRFRKTLAVVLIASVWAGISRINWIPMPGLMAATLYFLERPKEEGTALWRYLVNPSLWVGLGSVLGLVAQSLYPLISGNQAEWFASVLSSPLLWNRLLPDPTNKTGVLPAILIASAGLLFIIVRKASSRPSRWHPVRILSLAVILVVLFFGGLIVSVKIGGGDDLHNMDAFLILLMVVGSYLIFDRAKPDLSAVNPVANPSLLVLSIVFMVPILFAIGFGGPMVRHDQAKAQQALAEMQALVDQATAQGGEVLFMYERQLLTFGYIQGVDLVPQHEKTFLMEMAMSDNQAYFDAFEEELKAGRYALILAGLQTDKIRRADRVFREEGNAWGVHVSALLLEYYQPAYWFDLGESKLGFWVPKP